MSSIIVYNNYICIKSSYDKLLSLQSLLQYKDSSFCFNRGSFDKNKIVIRNMFYIKNDIGYCSIGFKNIILDFFKKYNFDYIDKRKDLIPYPYNHDDIKYSLSYLELYEYQVKAVKTCLAEKNCIIKLPTSAGKTEIFLSLCKLMNIPTIILFNRIDLAYQTMSRAIKADIDTGIAQGYNLDEEHMIVMSTIQSTHKLTKKYKMVIVDECHLAVSKSYQNFLNKEEFIYRFGFSATPFHKDSYKTALIKKNIGDIAYTLKANYLIDNNKIALPKIKMIYIHHPYIWDMGWDSCEKHGIIENDYRNNKIKELCNTNKKILILIKKIRHGKILNKLILNSIFISGITNVEKRKKEIKNFTAGYNNILIASTIFDEGISIDNIECLIIAGGGVSQIKSIQRLGRGLRITKEKNSVDVYDFIDNTNKILKEHSKKRISYYKREGFTDIEIINNYI